MKSFRCKFQNILWSFEGFLLCFCKYCEFFKTFTAFKIGRWIHWCIGIDVIFQLNGQSASSRNLFWAKLDWTRYTGTGLNEVKLDLLVLMTHQINDEQMAYVDVLRISELCFEAQMNFPCFSISGLNWIYCWVSSADSSRGTRITFQLSCSSTFQHRLNKTGSKCF